MPLLLNMKMTLSMLVVSIFASTLAGCTFGSIKYHTHDSGFIDQLLSPDDELDARTKYYQKRGLSLGEAQHKAYSESDPSERPYFRIQAEEIRSKEITKEDMKRWSKGTP